MSVFFQIFLLLAAVAFGGVIVELVSSLKQKNLIKILLAFSGGFLLAIAFAHFLPELYHDHAEQIGVYVLLGFLIQLFLEYFSGGIEHGHVHHHGKNKFPLVLLISLSVHSLIEGIPLTFPKEALEETHSSHSGISLLMGILFHQIPVAVALMTLLKQTGLSRLNSWLTLFLFGIMTPTGLLIGYFSKDNSNLIETDYILAIVMGMFLHISTTIIFETSENHKFNLMKLTSILAGVLLALFIH